MMRGFLSTNWLLKWNFLLTDYKLQAAKGVTYLYKLQNAWYSLVIGEKVFSILLDYEETRVKKYKVRLWKAIEPSFR